jgi:probable rRNA maturation factor
VTQSASLRLKLDILLAEPAWRRRLPKAAAICRGAARAALAAAGVTGSYACTVALGNDRLLRRLNRRYRGRDRPTNVLAFPADFPATGPRALGDIAISLETMAREARRQGKTLAQHLSHLAAHASLHLLGYDHDRPRAAKQMESLEILALGRLGIANPYELPQD